MSARETTEGKTMKVREALAIAQAVREGGVLEYRNLALVGELAYTLATGADTVAKREAYEVIAEKVNAWIPGVLSDYDEARAKAASL